VILPIVKELFSRSPLFFKGLC